MTAQHTPERWHAYDRGIGWEVHRSGPPNNWCETSPESCGDVIWDGFRETVAEANARLIAAAPLMLEALRALMTAYATIPGMSGLPMPDPDAWHQARDAIRAATGEDA